MLKCSLPCLALGDAFEVFFAEVFLALALGGEGGGGLLGGGARHHKGYDECGEARHDGDGE